MGPHSKRNRIGLSLALTFVLATAMVALAGGTALAASLDDTVTATSMTNPGQLEQLDSWWRAGWGNSLFPNLKFTMPPSDTTVIDGVSREIPTTGFLYRVDRNPLSRIDTTLPDPLSVSDVHWSQSPDGALFDQTVDLQGVFDQPPLGGWPLFAGATTPIEGKWWMHVVPANYLRYSNREWFWFIGYDKTPPAKPTTLDVGASGWTNTQRRKLSWSGASDALSGLGAYQVLISSPGMKTRGVRVTQPKPTPPGYVFGAPVESVTVEDLGPGTNTITVQAVDRAGNLSATITGKALVDTDTPIVTITSPVSGVGRSAVFAATVKELAGVREVRFYVDGILRRSTPSAPYSVTYDTSALSQGTHTLQVQATDMYGHIGSASKKFTVDHVVPVISGMSAGPSPFYPRLVNGYKDYSYIDYRVSKGVTATLQVMTGAGTVILNITKKVGSGSNEFVWNGRTSGGVVPEGTYYYRIVATDSVGNRTVTGLVATTVRYYIIQRLSDNSVRLVPE